MYFLFPLLDNELLEIGDGVWAIHSLILSFNKYLQSIYQKPGTTLGTGDIAPNKTKFPIFMDILAKALANCGLQTKSGSLYVFVKFYWNIATVSYLHIAYDKVFYSLYCNIYIYFILSDSRMSSYNKGHMDLNI